MRLAVFVVTLFFISFVVSQTPTASRSNVNPVIPSDTPTATPISKSRTPTTTETLSNTPSISPSRTLSNSGTPSNSPTPSGSTTASATPSRSLPPSVIPPSTAPNITGTPSPSSSSGINLFDGPDSNAVEFDLFACGGSCSPAQIQIIIERIANFLGISVDSVEIVNRNGVLYVVVCTNEPDELLNAIAIGDPELESNLLEHATIVSDPIYLDRCPIIIEESASDAHVIAFSMTLATITSIAAIFSI